MDTPADAPDKDVRKLELALLVLRLFAGLAALGLVVSLLAAHFRAPLVALGDTIVARFGLPGMALGTLIADGFQFPIPPQFYMLASIAAGAAPARVLVAIALGSIAGGHLGMICARRLAELAFVKRITGRGPIPALFRRHRVVAVTVASLLPLPYSLLCYTCGVLRTPYRLFALACALRVPKLLLYYVIIRAGWGA